METVNDSDNSLEQEEAKKGFGNIMNIVEYCIKADGGLLKYIFKKLVYIVKLI